MDALFAKCADRERTAHGTLSHEITASYVEIYNERVIDLLSPAPTPLSRLFGDFWVLLISFHLLALREDTKVGIVIEGLLEAPISNPEDALKVSSLT